MPPTDLAELNTQFAVADHLTFAAGPGGLPVADLQHAQGAARVALQGAQVLSFQPHGAQPVIWVSACSRYAPGKSIRGGIPVCWPWFGPHPTDPSKPQHGFARTALWSVRGTGITPQGEPQLQLELAASEATRALWPYPFDLEMRVSVGAALQVELITRNPGPAPFTYGAALHSYFGVSQVQDITILGLEGGIYIDKTDNGARKPQPEPLRITGKTDRVYLDTTAPCVIADPGRQRGIRIAKAGSRTTVVWNPGPEDARQMVDFCDDEYPGMVCVETANAGPDLVTVPPGGEARLSAHITVERAPSG